MNKDRKFLDVTDEDSSISDFFEECGEHDEALKAFDKQPLSASSEEEVTLDSNSAVIESTEEETVNPNKCEESKKDRAKNKKIYSTIYDLLSVIMSSFVIIAIIFTFAFRLVGVEGESMTNTLQHGDWLITVSKPEYKYGDIVIITQDTYFHKPLIKRVIATEGQVVDVDYANNQFFVDGKPLNEPYVKEDYLLERAEYRQFPYTVPEGCLFCMGDNRNGSSDSRTDLVGPIDERQILGKAVIRLIPFGDFNIYDYE